VEFVDVRTGCLRVARHQDVELQQHLGRVLGSRKAWLLGTSVVSTVEPSL
jgi:hypothetical protein